MITPISGIASFLASNRNKLTVPIPSLLGIAIPQQVANATGFLCRELPGKLTWLRLFECEVKPFPA